MTNPRRALGAARPRAESCLGRVSSGRTDLLAAVLSGMLALALPRASSAEPLVGAPVVMDRSVVRFIAPETGGAASPRFVFERVLAFEARLEALSDPGHRAAQAGAYSETHVRAALERHIAETLLASLSIEPKPTVSTVESQMTLARAMLSMRVGGEQKLRAAARAEGIDTQQLRRFLRRRALASLYLHHMVAPMLAPQDSELRELHAKGALADRPFEQAKAELKALYVSRALREAVSTFYQNARPRLKVTILH